MDLDLLIEQNKEFERNSEERHDNLLDMLLNVHEVAERSTKHSKILENKIQELDECNKDKKEIENLLLTCNTENEKGKLLINRIMSANERLKFERDHLLETKIQIIKSNEKLIDQRDQLLETKIRIMRLNERLVDERDQLLETQIRQQQRSNTGVWDFARKSTETSNQKSGINIGKAQDAFTTAQRTKAQTEADKQKAQAEIRRQNQLMAPKLLDCLASYFPEFRNPEFRATPYNTMQQTFISAMCSTIPNFNEEQVTRNYTKLLAAYESLSIEQIQIIDDKIAVNTYYPSSGPQTDSIRGIQKLEIVKNVFTKIDMSEFCGNSQAPQWFEHIILFDVNYGGRQRPDAINMPLLFTNLKGVIECFITLIYSFKPDVDPEILNKLQLLKDNEEKYVIEQLQKKTQGLGITRRKRKSKSNTRKKQIKNRKTKRRINKRKRS